MIVVIIFLGVQPSFAPYWTETGDKAGTLSALLLLVVIYPGISRRFKLKGIFLDAQIIIQTFRKELGISMYLLGVCHYFLLKVFPATILGFGSVIATRPFEFFGTLTLLLGLPLFLTSSDWTKQVLKKNWTKLHKLVYIMIGLLFFHLFLQSPTELSTILVGLGALTETASLVYKHTTVGKKIV